MSVVFFRRSTIFLRPGFSFFIKLIKFVCLSNAVGIVNQYTRQITGITVDMVISSKVTVYYADIKLAVSLFAFLFVRVVANLLLWECEMLIKDRDPAEKAVAQLTDLLSLNLSSTKKFLIERELKRLNPEGNVARTASHFINFYCADCPDWAIIHDLKIESNGFATQIDHILINKFLDIHLFESRNYNDNIKISADGEFLVFDGYRYQSVDSPLEENIKRTQVLADLLIENKILPKRLGISLKPKISSYVLVSPGANVLRPPETVCDTSSVVTADYLTKTLLRQLERFKRTFERIKRLPKALKTDTLAKVAAKLAAMNKPNLIDYRRIFCLEDLNITSAPGASNQDAFATCDYAI